MPSMIELFSRKSKDLKFEFETGMTPIHLSESVASLSAILLNDSYIQGKTIVDGYLVLSIEYILLFKVMAWLDLLERKENGEHMDSRDITTFLKRITEERIDLKNLGIRAVSLNDILILIEPTTPLYNVGVFAYPAKKVY
ncbi:MAG: hypothetical protein ACREV6_06135 [Clostridium sp.]|uniref:hypothetical protein n=1 Tax=Clostridium sp. TaxID=1506 RepID=UPI003D6C8EA8